MDLLECLFMNETPSLSGKDIEVGLSGGLDSVVLLHMLSRLRQQHGFSLRAVHVHHGLSPNADDWAEFCLDYCNRLSIPIRIAHVRVKKGNSGIEAAARAERYRVFSDGLSDILALAHHQNDQVETFMLAVVRGGGLRSLAAMPQQRDLNAETKIWRPLLPFTRSDLQHYADLHHLDFIEDESNKDSTYLRNWLRNEALPAWRGRIPYFDRHILSNIRSLQEDLELLDEIVRQDYEFVHGGGRFSVAKWRNLGSRRCRHVLRHFVLQHGLGTPSQSSISDFERVLMESDKAEWKLPAGTVYSYRGSLFPLLRQKMDKISKSEGKVIRGRLKDILLDNGFVLQPSPFGLSEELLAQEGIVRNMNNNDVIKLDCGTKPVKKVLQEYHILPLVRKSWPIIINADKECVAVANLRAGVDFQVENGVIPVFFEYQEYITELNYK